MYKIFSELSLMIRIYFCYLTIDNIPILKNNVLNNLLLEIISLYTLLRLITYYEVGIFYKKSDDSTVGVILYFFLYLFNLLFVYLIMLFLTKINVLPI